MNDSSSPNRPRRILVTGATGLLGSHVVEHARQAGHIVTALVRSSANTTWLRQRQIPCIPGDLTNPDDCEHAVSGQEWVIHCASRVGDWGPWREFQRDSIRATQTLGTAAARARVDRFIHVSSTSAYGHPRTPSSQPVEESFPLGAHLWLLWDHYTRSKVEQERALWNLAQASGLRLTIIRPSWLYGERDRTTTARIVTKILKGGIPLIGSGDNPLSAVYAGVVADAILLAAQHPAALGQAFNITDQGPITQRGFFDLWARTLNRPPTRIAFPYPAVFAFGFLLEALGKLTRRRKPPLITRYAAWLMGRPTRYSTDKARSLLGWTPSTSYDQAVARTVAWYLSENT
jgi:nucleoside-diphosphate-sugar epimerase